MKTFEFNKEEIGALLEVLRYYTDNLDEDSGGVYDQALDLYKKLKPKKIKREGWLAVYPNGDAIGVYNTDIQARNSRSHGQRGAPQAIRITWEQEE